MDDKQHGTYSRGNGSPIEQPLSPPPSQELPIIMDSNQGQHNPSGTAPSGLDKVLREGKSETLNKAKESLKKRMLQSIMQQTMEELRDADSVADDILAHMEGHEDVLTAIKNVLKARLLEQAMQQALAEIDEEVVDADEDVLDAAEDLALAAEQEFADMDFDTEDTASDYSFTDEDTERTEQTENIWSLESDEADEDAEEDQGDTHAELALEDDDAVGEEFAIEEEDDASEIQASTMPVDGDGAEDEVEDDESPYFAEEPDAEEGTVFFAQPVEEEPEPSAGDENVETHQDVMATDQVDEVADQEDAPVFEQEAYETAETESSAEEEYMEADTVFINASETSEDEDALFSTVEGDGSLSWLVDDVKEDDLSYETFEPYYDRGDDHDTSYLDEAEETFLDPPGLQHTDDEGADHDGAGEPFAVEPFSADEFAPEIVLGELEATEPSGSGVDVVEEEDETGTWEVFQFEDAGAAGEAEDADTGLYVYGILGSSLEQAADILPAQGMDQTHPVEILSHGTLHAVVSKVPMYEFGEAAMHNNLRDEQWIAAHVRLHEGLLEHLMQHVSLLPMRFCTVYPNAQRVREMLDERGPQFEETLNRLQGNQEWGVRIYNDVEEIRRRVVEDSERVRSLLTDMKSKPRGVAHFIKKQMVVAIHEEVEAFSEACIQETQETLDAYSEAAASQEVQPTEAEDVRGSMIYNTAFLVQRSDEDAFKDEIERLGAKYADFGFSFERTGPWPPYSFAQTPATEQAE